MPPPCAGYRALIRTRARDWQRGASPLHAFGGRPLLDAALPLVPSAGRPLTLTFDLDLADPRLALLPATGLRRLAILAPLGLELPAGELLVVRHEEGGRRLELIGQPRARVADEIPELAQLPVELEPLSEAEAAVETRDEMPDGGEEFHQVGGRLIGRREPASAPRCPVSGEPTLYLASVASIRRYPLADADVALSFGTDGVLHVFWSAAARATVALIDE